MFLVRGTGGLFEGNWFIASLHKFVEWEHRHSIFDGASAIIVPSRSEPFGMVVLETMQNGVPVFFAKDAGVGEVLRAGVQIDPRNADEIATSVCRLLADEQKWNEIVETQRSDLLRFMNDPYEERVREVWNIINKG